MKLNGHLAAELESQKREYERKLKEKDTLIQNMKAKQRFENALSEVNLSRFDFVTRTFEGSKFTCPKSSEAHTTQGTKTKSSRNGSNHA